VVEVHFSGCIGCLVGELGGCRGNEINVNDGDVVDGVVDGRWDFAPIVARRCSLICTICRCKRFLMSGFLVDGEVW
jgi:hypothetical protein